MKPSPDYVVDPSAIDKETIKRLSEEHGLNYGTVRYRILNGLPIEKPPVQSYTIEGVGDVTLPELANKLNMGYKDLYNRMHYIERAYKWSRERALNFLWSELG